MANRAENRNDPISTVSGDKNECGESVSNKDLLSGEQREDSEGDFFTNSWDVIKVGT